VCSILNIRQKPGDLFHYLSLWVFIGNVKKNPKYQLHRHRSPPPQYAITRF
jgi:hypothetical protein